jgi:hypothetical protein
MINNEGSEGNLSKHLYAPLNRQPSIIGCVSVIFLSNLAVELPPFGNFAKLFFESYLVVRKQDCAYYFSKNGSFAKF